MRCSLHLAACPVWVHGDTSVGCTCPRPWRVRKSTVPGDQFPWRIERHIPGENIYTLFMRTGSHVRALALATALSELEGSRVP